MSEVEDEGEDVDAVEDVYADLPPMVPALPDGRHMRGCNTQRRGCMPGCCNFDPKYDGAW